MTTTANHAAATAAIDCGCGGACETIDAWCRGCGHRGDFHVVEGDINPIEYWTCESGLHTYSRELMSQAEILAESRKGGWH